MPNKLYASWASGHTATCESPATRVLRQGFGATFTIPANLSDWIHLSIPSPVLEENARATLDKVLVLFDARQTGALVMMDVWDGPTRIASFREMKTQGNHSQGIDSQNVFSVRQNNIRFGIGISMNFAAFQNESQFFISSFGGDFFHNIP